MERNEYADEFADCVVRRTQWDTVMKPGMVLLTMFVPAIIAMAIVTFVLDSTSRVIFTDDSVRAGILIILVTECSVMGFLLYMMAGRTSNHQKRDMIWSGALMGYVGSKGGDASKLESLSKDLRKIGRAPLKFISFVLWGFSVLCLFVLAFYFFATDGNISDSIYLLGTASYILLLVQFLLTIGTTYGFPRAHEDTQIEFTRELSSQLSAVGISVDPMERIVGKPHRTLMLVLFIITLGLFSFVMFILACRNMNLHLRNQWDYEKKVLDAIIEHEGGKGIEPVDGASPGIGKKLIRSLM